jgi:ACR3 family arsenite efflux pump ArsB
LHCTVDKKTKSTIAAIKAVPPYLISLLVLALARPIKMRQVFSVISIGQRTNLRRRRHDVLSCSL